MEILEKTEGTLSAGTVNVICLRGRLDAYTANDLDEKLKSMAATNQIRLVLNLKELEYVGSSGLRVLLAALKQVKKQGGDIRLAGLQTSVKDVFDMAGFTQFFQMHDEEEDAIKSF